MALQTPIQWCDSSVNPAMGCGGCELWPTNATLKLRMVTALNARLPYVERSRLRELVHATMGDDEPTILWKKRWTIIATMMSLLYVDLNKE